MQTVRAILLGTRLRELRENAHVKPQEACDHLGWSRSKLDRIEAGATVIKATDLQAVFDEYNVDDKTRADLEQTRREAAARRRNWWVGFADVFKTPLPALEHDARRIQSYETDLVPGLLQTPDYARAVISAGRPDFDEEAVDKRVQARSARQAAIFERRDAPAVHVILDEAALRRTIGGIDVMNGQLSELWTKAHKPNLTLQVIPLDAGAHPGLEGSFLHLIFDDPAYPGVVFTEGHGGHLYLEGAVDLARMSTTWDRLAAVALSPDDSAKKLVELTR